MGVGGPHPGWRNLAPRLKWPEGGTLTKALTCGLVTQGLHG